MKVLVRASLVRHRNIGIIGIICCSWRENFYLSASGNVFVACSAGLRTVAFARRRLGNQTLYRHWRSWFLSLSRHSPGLPEIRRLWQYFFQLKSAEGALLWQGNHFVREIMISQSGSESETIDKPNRRTSPQRTGAGKVCYSPSLSGKCYRHDSKRHRKFRSKCYRNWIENSSELSRR